MTHRRPCTVQMLAGKYAMRKHNRTAIGVEKNFARIGELMRCDAEWCRLFQFNARQTAACFVHCEMRAALLDTLCQRTIITQPGNVTCLDAGQKSVPAVLVRGTEKHFRRAGSHVYSPSSAANVLAPPPENRVTIHRRFVGHDSINLHLR